LRPLRDQQRPLDLKPAYFTKAAVGFV